MNTQSNNEINTTYALPQRFYDRIEPYVSRVRTNRRIIADPSDLLALWQDALKYRTEYLELQESIAEWTVSAVASSPLIADDDLFKAIHNAFETLELPGRNNNTLAWHNLGRLVAEAQARTHS